MAWMVKTVVDQRREFIQFAKAGGLSFSALCQRFGISRKTGYKWLNRALSEGESGLLDRSRRPGHSPHQTALAVEDMLVELREQYPCWGARKLQKLLQSQGIANPPAVSTCHQLLRRRGLIDPLESPKHTPFIRFEHPAANCLWQMDYKGHFSCGPTRWHPLTVLDDHSRFNLVLQAHGNQRCTTVQAALIQAFRCYGLPDRMTMDNGSPWGDDGFSHWTIFTVWLMHLDIAVSHSRPAHPQTQGKDERFHRTLDVELIQRNQFADLAQAQQAMDAWRTRYNTLRPHEALGMQAPVSRYQPSARPYPEKLPVIEYAPGVEVRRVEENGRFSFRGKTFRLSKAFFGKPIGLQPTLQEGVFEILFSRFALATLDFHTQSITRKGVSSHPANV